MQLNEVHDTSEHASVSLKVILLIFAVVLVGVLGYLVWDNSGMQDNTEYGSQIVTKKRGNEVVAMPSLACGDAAKYGFALTFSNKWDGYKIYQVLQQDMNPQPGYALVTCYFTLPTTTSDAVWMSAGPDHLAKYASIFAVSVYTPAQWVEAEKEANKPTKLGENANYVWGWGPAQALPQDLQDSNIASDVANVVQTFAIVPPNGG